MFSLKNVLFLKKTLAVILAGIFLFTNAVSWAQEEKLFSTAKKNNVLSSGLVQDNKLAPSLRTKNEKFRKLFLTAQLLPPHSLVNDHIRHKIEEIGYENLQKEMVKIKGVEGKIELIAIPELLSKTGQFSHEGLGKYYKRPVIYIDSALYNDEDMRQHAFDEIKNWEVLRNKLGLKPEEMRGWIKNYIDTPVSVGSLLKTDYYEKTAIEIAEIINKKCHPIPRSLYEEYADKIDYAYLMDIFSRYDDQAIKEKDVNLAAHGDSHVDKEMLLIGNTRFPGALKTNLSAMKKEGDKIFREIYPKDLLTKMRQDGYDPIIVGYDHDLINIVNIKAAFKAIREANPGQAISVAYEIIPAIQLQHLKDFVEAEREYAKSGTIRGKKADANTPAKLAAYRNAIKCNKHHAEILALWLLDEGFDLIPINSQDVQGWISEDRDKITSEMGNDYFFDDLVPDSLRPALTAIRSDIYGIEVIERERPHIIAVGSAHAFKFDLLLERDGARSFYFFVGNSFLWDELLDLWRTAHSLYSRGRANTEQEASPDANRPSTPPSGGGFLNNGVYKSWGSPASCLGSIIKYCKDDLEKDFNALDIFDSGLREKKDKKTSLSLETVKLELRQLYQAGVLDLTGTAKPYRYILRSDIRNLSPLKRNNLISAIGNIPELNNYRTAPEIIKSVVRSQVEKMIEDPGNTGAAAGWKKGVNLPAFWQRLSKNFNGKIPSEVTVSDIRYEFLDFIRQPWEFTQLVIDSKEFKKRIIAHYGSRGEEEYGK
ncbi:MAG: hypothetical protein PHW46_04060, partial [Candidatus Omnitrophica bacterium]|nr:hypothetical protein [Candidatus Omnitrophota bacterium]